MKTSGKPEPTPKPWLTETRDEILQRLETAYKGFDQLEALKHSINIERNYLREENEKLIKENERLKEKCSYCEGTGYVIIGGRVKCGYCDGTGWVSIVEQLQADLQKMHDGYDDVVEKFEAINQKQFDENKQLQADKAELLEALKESLYSMQCVYITNPTMVKVESLLSKYEK